jgi:predicted SnoaL-like aldol condensation-catalyzing enzyme
MTKKRPYGDNWKKTHASDNELQTAKSVIASFLKPDELNNQEINRPSSPISHISSSPISSPIESQASPKNTKNTWLDNTHTEIERLAYIELYKMTVKKGNDSCYINFRELARRTGKSLNTMRTAIKGLINKLSIEPIDGSPGSHHGFCYRVYKPSEIMARRSKAGIEIDEGSKIILSSKEDFSLPSYASSYPSSYAASYPISSPTSYASSYAIKPKIGEEIAQEIGEEIAQEEGSLLIDINQRKKYINHGSIMIAPDGADKIKKFFEDFFGKENPQAQQASAIVTQMVVDKLTEQATRATRKPTSPKFFVTCMANLLASKDSSGLTTPDRAIQTPEQSLVNKKQREGEIFHAAVAMWFSNQPEANESEGEWQARVGKVIKDHCLAEYPEIDDQTLDRLILQARNQARDGV